MSFTTDDQNEIENRTNFRSVKIEFPLIQFEGSVIHVGDRSYSARSGTAHHIILSYFQSDQGVLLDRVTLIRMLYGQQSLNHPVTIRFMDGKWLRAIKYISRLRQALCERFFGLVPVGTQWLHFSTRRDGWILYKLPGLGSDGRFHS